MKNFIEIDGQKALIAADPDTGFFRGEFLGLRGGADFYAETVEGLIEEGRISLSVYLEVCSEHGIEPYPHPVPVHNILSH